MNKAIHPDNLALWLMHPTPEERAMYLLALEDLAKKTLPAWRAQQALSPKEPWVITHCPHGKPVNQRCYKCRNEAARKLIEEVKQYKN